MPLAEMEGLGSTAGSNSIFLVKTGCILTHSAFFYPRLCLIKPTIAQTAQPRFFSIPISVHRY